MRVAKLRIRLPRFRRPKNAFRAGTSGAQRGLKRSLVAHTAALAANNIPGKAVAAGALGAKLGGPPGAVAAFSAASAISTGATAALAARIGRRTRLANYLARRSKRKKGVYKAGLLRPGKPPLMRRIGFLLRSGRDERIYRVGRYLTSRTRGARLPGRAKRRTGTYTNVYKGAHMDIVDDALEAIAKARYMVRLSPAQRRKAVTERAYAANTGRGLSRTRGGFGRTKPTAQQILRQRDAFYPRSMFQQYRDAKRWGSGKGKHFRNVRRQAKEAIQAFRARRGEASPYKRTLFGGLKRVRKVKGLSRGQRWRRAAAGRTSGAASQMHMEVGRSLKRQGIGNNAKAGRAAARWADVRRKKKQLGYLGPISGLKKAGMIVAKVTFRGKRMSPAQRRNAAMAGSHKRSAHPKVGWHERINSGESTRLRYLRASSGAKPKHK